MQKAPHFVALTNYVTQMPHLWHWCGAQPIRTQFTPISTYQHHLYINISILRGASLASHPMMKYEKVPQRVTMVPPLRVTLADFDLKVYSCTFYTYKVTFRAYFHRILTFWRGIIFLLGFPPFIYKNIQFVNLQFIDPPSTIKPTYRS